MKDYFRKCLKCRKQKPVKEFYLDRFSRSGFYHRCKLCTDNYYKKCSKCERFKEKTDFYSCKKTKDRLESACVACKRGKEYKEPATYYEATKTEYIKRNIAYIRKRSKIDPQFRLMVSLRTRLWSALKAKKWHKDSKFANILGCSKDAFVAHIESHFTEGMNWANYGNKTGCWSIDHTIPISTSKNKEEAYKLSHFTNLKPMWHIENMRKGNR